MKTKEKKYLIINKDSNMFELAKTLDKDSDYVIINDGSKTEDEIAEIINIASEIKLNNSRPFPGDEPILLKNHRRLDIPVMHWSDEKNGPELEPVRTEPKIGRNDICLCGSGKKYKKCCGK